MKRRCALRLATTLAGLVVPCAADAQAWVLENRAYYEPLLAEIRAAQVNLLFPARSDAFPYAQKPGSRIVWNIDLGKETPIAGWESRLASLNDLPAGGFGIGLWLPVDFHMIEDLNVDPSAPIIDTDYRFSLMLKAQYALPKQSRVCLGVESCRLGVRLQAGHESTHLGDEFSLGAQRTHADFERINVSYEYLEGAASLDVDVGDASELTVRAGIIGLVKPEKGWYSYDTAETNGAAVTLSRDSREWYVGLQFVQEDRWQGGLAKWIFRKDVGWFASLEARQRNVYGYHRASSETPEAEQLSFNLMVGLRPDRKFLEKGVPDLYLRWYRGVNPFGQFRSQRDYELIGFGIHIDV